MITRSCSRAVALYPNLMKTSLVNHNLQAIRLERYIYLLLLLLKVIPSTKCYLTATTTINFVEPLTKCTFVYSSGCFSAGLAINPCLWIFYLCSKGCCLSINSVHFTKALWPMIIIVPHNLSTINLCRFIPTWRCFQLVIYIIVLHFLWFWVMLSTCDL